MLFTTITAIATTFIVGGMCKPVLAESRSCDFGPTTVWYSATARDCYAGIEMSTDTECSMECYGDVYYENQFGESGTRVFRTGDDFYDVINDVTE